MIVPVAADCFSESCFASCYA